MKSAYIFKLIDRLAQLNGSDLHITADKNTYFRVKKQIIPCEPEIVFSNQDIVSWLKEIGSKNNNFIKEEAIDRLTRGEGDVDFAYSYNDTRLRGHAYCTRGGSVAIAFRKIDNKIPSIEDLKLPLTYKTIIEYPQGLILVTGATGSGKSTTIASIIDMINAKYRKHILTIEQPIEFIYEDKKSIVHQKEVGKDIPTYKEGIKSSLREDPDVILIGEIRDADEMLNALTLSASGHLVFATLHTSGIIHTIGRIISLFGASEENMLRGLLQDNLKGIINQSLHKTDAGDIIPLLEHLFVDSNTYRVLNNGMNDSQIKQLLESASNKERHKVMFRWQSILSYFNNSLIDYPEAKKLIETYDIESLAKFEAQKAR